MSDTLMEEPRKDGFTHESPIRAFTTWTVEGCYAIGKGFRPSLQHLTTYLNAMEVKEGWKLVQIIGGESDHPTMLFRQSRELTIPELVAPLRDPALAEEVADMLQQTVTVTVSDVKPGTLKRFFDGGIVGAVPAGVYWCDTNGTFYDQITGKPMNCEFYKAWVARRDEFPEPPEVTSGHIDCDKEREAERIKERDGIVGRKTLGEFVEAHKKGVVLDGFGQPVNDDPVNPKHYHGRACADLGERMTANSYQVLKYNWRLGEKDSPCVELGKAIWYLDSEIALHQAGGVTFPGSAFPRDSWLCERIEGLSEHVIDVAWHLVRWNRTGGIEHLCALRSVLQTRLDSYNGCTEFGRQQEP